MKPERTIVAHPEPWLWLVSSWSAPSTLYTVTAELLVGEQWWRFDADCACQLHRPGKMCPHTRPVAMLFRGGPCCLGKRCIHNHNQTKEQVAV